MFRIGGEGGQRFRRNIEQQPVDCRLVGVGDGADRFGEREDDVVILDGQQIGLPRFQPTLRGLGLAFGVVPVAEELLALISS